MKITKRLNGICGVLKNAEYKNSETIEFTVIEKSSQNTEQEELPPVPWIPDNELRQDFYVSEIEKPIKWKAKLTEKQVEEIRDRYNSTNISQVKLSEEYNIHSTTIYHIVNNKTWKI